LVIFIEKSAGLCKARWDLALVIKRNIIGFEVSLQIDIYGIFGATTSRIYCAIEGKYIKPLCP